MAVFLISPIGLLLASGLMVGGCVSVVHDYFALGVPQVLVGSLWLGHFVGTAISELWGRG